MRLDIVVRRRDRVFEATAVALFIAIVIAMFWPIVLVIFWGILDGPWWSLVPGLIGTALLIRWGVFLGRGSLTTARGTGPYVLVQPDGLAVWNPAEPEPVGGLRRIPRDAVDLVALDQPPERQRRADRVRFPVFADSPRPGAGSEEAIGWLYCPDESSLRTIVLGLGGAPNLLVFAPRAGASFMAEVVDPAAAQVPFERWSVLRPLRLVDVRSSLSDSLLPVIRYGQHGLREVRGEDRIRARLVDAFLLLVLSLTVVPRFTQTLGGLLFGFVLLWFLLEVPSSA